MKRSGIPSRLASLTADYRKGTTLANDNGKGKHQNIQLGIVFGYRFNLTIGLLEVALCAQRNYKLV